MVTWQVVTWRSVPGKSYRVYAAEAVGSEFTPVSGVITALTGSTSFTHTAVVTGQGYYRVVAMP